jgi:hypothetical protein
LVNGDLTHFEGDSLRTMPKYDWLIETIESEKKMMMRLNVVWRFDRLIDSNVCDKGHYETAKKMGSIVL